MATPSDKKCWFNRFHPTLPQCENQGRWRYGGDRVANSFLLESRWCDEHKHDTDTLIESVMPEESAENG